MKSDPAGLVQEWLDHQEDEGLWHSRGRFTVDPDGAQRQGIVRLGLSDVPLLLLAGAVEGGSRYFRVHGEHNVRLSWEGSPGECSMVARSLLENASVDSRWEASGVELPPFFDNYLGTLSLRGRHAPLNLIWNNRVISAVEPGPKILMTRTTQPRLTVVDRGVDFTLPGAFSGWDIVAWIDPLLGSPWPRRLVWGPELREQIQRIARAAKSATSRACP